MVLDVGKFVVSEVLDNVRSVTNSPFSHLATPWFKKTFQEFTFENHRLDISLYGSFILPDSDSYSDSLYSHWG